MLPATVEPVSILQEQELLYRRWLTRRHDTVERLSRGTVTYVDLREMNQRSYREAFDEVFGPGTDKERLICSRGSTSTWDLGK